MPLVLCSSCAYWPLQITSLEEIRIADCQEGWTKSCQCSNSRNWSDDSRQKEAKNCCERLDQKISFKNNLGLREAFPLACSAETTALHSRIGRPGPRRRAVRTPGVGRQPPPPPQGILISKYTRDNEDNLSQADCKIDQRQHF